MFIQRKFYIVIQLNMELLPNAKDSAAKLLLSYYSQFRQNHRDQLPGKFRTGPEEIDSAQMVLGLYQIIHVYLFMTMENQFVSWNPGITSLSPTKQCKLHHNLAHFVPMVCRISLKIKLQIPNGEGEYSFLSTLVSRLMKDQP